MKKEYVTPEIEIETFNIDSYICAQSNDLRPKSVAYEEEVG